METEFFIVSKISLIGKLHFSLSTGAEPNHPSRGSRLLPEIIVFILLMTYMVFYYLVFIVFPFSIVVRWFSHVSHMRFNVFLGCSIVSIVFRCVSIAFQWLFFPQGFSHPKHHGKTATATATATTTTTTANSKL